MDTTVPLVFERVMTQSLNSQEEEEEEEAASSLIFFKVNVGPS
jgi:hypothetical protein